MTATRTIGSAAQLPVERAFERPHTVAAQAVLVAALIILPLIYTLVPPLQDYPNHLARMFALSSLPGNETLGHFYQVDWAAIPNLIMDIVVPPLVPFFGVYMAGRIFIGLTLLLMLLGPMALQRALYGRWSAWPLIGGLFLYNGFLFVGLMNYLFGVGVAVFGLSAWIGLSRRSPVLRAFVSLAFCAVLYTCHLSALGLYGLSIASFEAWRLWNEKRWRSSVLAVSAATLGMPFLPFLYLLVTSPTWRLSHDISWQAQGKLEGLTMMVSVYSDLTDIPLLLMIATALWFGIHRKLIRIHPAGIVVAVVLSLAFLAMPRVAFGSWMADQRLVVGIFFMTLGFVSVDLRKLETNHAFFAICLVSVAFRVVDVSVNWSAISQPLLELRNSIRTMPPGSRLLVAAADETDAAVAIEAALAHAPNLAVIERSALVSRLFVVPGKQILQAREGAREHVDNEDGDTPSISRILASSDGPAASGPAYWDNWQETYDYLIVLGTDPDESANPDPDLLRMVHNGREFQLFRIKKPKP
ncbi:hypothetical protein [Microvirga brassicacearum]|uniref:Glycosyltransferase RgtA/B/C/D-like domain-containing protein n=1 Tax=Microvirga brassicacearum TaxID=2580413 RepID=A0A5N3P6N6_9HYPH|nr:hypothetical protein [Microvirga brassicacearum]KAB0265389.1 hypothetical protein FEZ63_18890 [Microvirga brassicacearum]